MKIFQQLKKDHRTYFQERNRIMRVSNEALQLSKRSIFDLHRNDSIAARKNIGKAKKLLQSLTTSFDKNPKLEFEGSYRAAMEEFVEATMFLRHVEKKAFMRIKGVNVFYEEYIGGLADMTGEIVRQSIKLVSHGEIKHIKHNLQTVEDVVSQLLEMDLTSKLRHKFDEAKRNLKRMEEILYDVEIKRRG